MGLNVRDKVSIFLAILCYSSLICSVKATVSYDRKAVIINGQRRILLSGSIHYPRSTPEMWPGLIQKAKEGGLDVIETYVFWNGHEPSPGNYYFGDRYDLVKFIKLVQQAGLYVNLRIGPFVCAEWNFGYTEFGGAVPYRPVEDIAYSVARFIQNGGSFVNYYMYHGGTNFDRTAGEFMASSYDYDAPLDEYGLPREPKYSHLKALHKVIKLSEPALVSADATVTYLGAKQEAHVFWSKSSCAAFLSNNDVNSPARVMFRGFPYDLPPWSVSILPDCKTEYYNTAKVNAPSVHRNMVSTGTRFSWESFNEVVPFANEAGTFARNGLVEQISMTWDKSDYLWYLTDITVGAGERFLKTGDFPLLTALSAGHALHVFVNGQLAGRAYGSLEHTSLTFSQKIKLHAGVNRLALLSVVVGLPSIFAAPPGNEPLAVDMNTMGKGQVWINGRNIGRHWAAYKAKGNCGRCNYAGTFTATKCLSNCGEASQRWYHVPRSWLKPQNVIVVFEEWGGDTSGISLVKRI
ncbi:hypothetical protein F2Q69_00019481 [Brassica cretica]|uniref:beta-galactosidase n=1 Tax=Brassica cretica TaxID=69181 RepID=A0A8S9QNI5_BRACR|nr:hypothetical protein F2Q69_00019481 [Brassica cretica]